MHFRALDFRVFLERMFQLKSIIFFNSTWDEKQQMKAHAIAGMMPMTAPARDVLTPAETTQLLALLDAVNTLVKHVFYLHHFILVSEQN